MTPTTKILVPCMVSWYLYILSIRAGKKEPDINILKVSFRIFGDVPLLAQENNERLRRANFLFVLVYDS